MYCICIYIYINALHLGFLTCASMAGAAAGLLVTTVLRQEQPYPQPAITSEHMRINNMIILYLCECIILLCR